MKKCKKYPDTLVNSIDGRKIRYKYCVGFCKNKEHIGYINKRLLKGHCCIEKSCYYFRPIKSNSYWIQKEIIDIEKNKIKEIRKEHKSIENSIMEQTPNEFKPIFCKYLYDDLYLLVIQSENRIDLSIYKNLNVSIFVKSISQHETGNIELTFHLLLPEEMREKYKSEKQKIKNDKNRRRM